METYAYKQIGKNRKQTNFYFDIYFTSTLNVKITVPTDSVRSLEATLIIIH